MLKSITFMVLDRFDPIIVIGGVAIGQRLGVKLELHCETPFAATEKLATSNANGNLSVRRGMDRHQN
jgi:hypothetical protein